MEGNPLDAVWKGDVRSIEVSLAPAPDRASDILCRHLVEAGSRG